MRLAGVAVVRNESDVIEAFVRHNLGRLDCLHIVDNLSTDSTAEIVRLLASEGLPVTLSSWPCNDHSQAEALTPQVWRLAEEGYDWVFALDADEFLSVDSKAVLCSELARVPPQHAGALRWLGYACATTTDDGELNVLRRLTQAIVNPRIQFKVVLPAALIRDHRLSLGQGNHSCRTADGWEVPPFLLAEERVRLAHFPVRSAAQFLSKVLVGEMALRARAARAPNEGSHWQRAYRTLARRLSVEKAKLLEQSVAYAVGPDGDPKVEFAERPLPASELRYGHLIAGDPLKAVFAFADGFFESYARTRLSNGHVRVGQTIHGPMMYHDWDTVIGKSLEAYGEWGANEIRFLERLVQPGDWVVDVGANVGTHTVAFSKAVGEDGKVYAFEAQRVVHQLLCGNVALNNCLNVHALNLGVSDAHGLGKLPVFAGGNVGAVKIEGWAHGEPLQLVPLDAFNFPRCNLIKIDVEGLEEKVLVGAAQTIARLRPYLFVENNQEAGSAGLISRLLGWGYDCYWHFEDYFNPDNLFGNAENMFSGERPEVNLFCVPSERKIAVRGLKRVAGPGERWQDALPEAAALKAAASGLGGGASQC